MDPGLADDLLELAPVPVEIVRGVVGDLIAPRACRSATDALDRLADSATFADHDRAVALSGGDMGHVLIGLDVEHVGSARRDIKLTAVGH
jgi:hypothetical protein